MLVDGCRWDQRYRLISCFFLIPHIRLRRSATPFTPPQSGTGSAVRDADLPEGPSGRLLAQREEVEEAEFPGLRWLVQVCDCNTLYASRWQVIFGFFLFCFVFLSSTNFLICCLYGPFMYVCLYFCWLFLITDQSNWYHHHFWHWMPLSCYVFTQTFPLINSS